MGDDALGDDDAERDVAARPSGGDPWASVEAYDEDDGVVLYDAENPLAWLKATNATAIREYR